MDLIFDIEHILPHLLNGTNILLMILCLIEGLDDGANKLNEHNLALIVCKLSQEELVT
jgi:hypothetical protein